MEPDARGIAAAKAYLYGPLRLNGHFYVRYGQELLPRDPVEKEAIATALMLAEFARPGLMDQGGRYRIMPILKEAVDDAIRDPQAVIDRARGSLIRVFDDFWHMRGSLRDEPEGAACAVDPADPDPDLLPMGERTRPTGKPGDTPTGDPETDPNANRIKQRSLELQNRSADLLAYRRTSTSDVSVRWH